MHRYFILSLFVACLPAFAPAVAHADLNVVTTVPNLAAITKEVGGSHVKVTALSLPTEDPHWVDAKPSLTLQVNRADLLLAVGMNLEVGWLPTLQTGSRNPKVLRGGKGFLECSQFVKALDVPAGAVDRSAGDIHPGGNPHYLYDPRAAAACARGIAAKMAELDPKNARAYQENLASFLSRLEARRAEWEKRLAPYRGTPIVTYHKSWVYLMDWIGLKEVASLEPKPGIPPSPGHVAGVIRTAREKGVKMLLQEAYYPTKTGELVATKVGAKLIALPSGASIAAGQSYIDHMDQVVSQLESALKK